MLTDCSVYDNLERFAYSHKGRRFEEQCDYLKIMYRTFMNKYDETIARKANGFTGHGMKHTDKILALYDQLLIGSSFILDLETAHKLGGSDLVKLDKGCDELFLLIAATIWHDAGMIHGRGNHANRVRNDPGILETIGGSLSGLNSRPKSKMVEHITRIAAAHSDNSALQECAPQITVSGFAGRDFSARANALAGILRLCDELSDDSSRIDYEYMGDVATKNKIYWIHSSCVESSSICLSEKSVKIDYEIPFEELKEVYQVTISKRVNGADVAKKVEVDLLNFILNRIDKVHAEMSVCCPLFSDFAQINSLEVTLSFTCKGKTSRSYPTIKMPNEILCPDRSDYYDDISRYKVCQAGKGHNINIDMNEINSWFA